MTSRSRVARSKIIPWSFSYESADGSLKSHSSPERRCHPVTGTAVVNKVSTDSRTIKRGELFVALRGENFEGHDFVEASAKAGATGALVDLSWAGNIPKNFVLLRATDTLQSYLKRWQPITGDRSA